MRASVGLPANRPPTHPGEMLKEEFLVPLGISQSEFARHAQISFPRINEICNGRRSVTTDTAMRFERLTGMPATFWLELQLAWDLWHTAHSPAGRKIAKRPRLAKVS